MSYVKEVAAEMRKVTWPTPRDVNKYTWTVIVTVILFSLYFAGVDFGFSHLMSWLMSF